MNYEVTDVLQKMVEQKVVNVVIAVIEQTLCDVFNVDVRWSTYVEYRTQATRKNVDTLLTIKNHEICKRWVSNCADRFVARKFKQPAIDALNDAAIARALDPWNLRKKIVEHHREQLHAYARKAAEHDFKLIIESLEKKLQKSEQGVSNDI